MPVARITYADKSMQTVNTCKHIKAKILKYERKNKYSIRQDKIQTKCIKIGICLKLFLKRMVSMSDKM